MASLVKEVEKVVAKSKEGTGVVISLDDNKDAATEKLKAFAKEHGLTKVALTVNKAGKGSPGGYKLNDTVKHTILVYEKKKVVHNFALNEIDEKSTKEVVAAAAKVLGAGA